jgi:hypothetical protein
VVLDSRVSATYLLKLVSSVFTNSWAYSCTVSTQSLDGTALVILQQGDSHPVRIESRVRVKHQLVEQLSTSIAYFSIEAYKIFGLKEVVQRHNSENA